MTLTANQTEAEAILREIGDAVALRLIEEIKRLRCENRRLQQLIEAHIKTNGKGP